MISNTKKGYFTLEAAILLPFFLIGILTLGYLIKIYSTAENITFSIIDETGHLAARACKKTSAPFFSQKTKQRLEQENSSLEQVQITKFRYLYTEGPQDGLITVHCRYQIGLALPVKLTDGVQMESRIKCRGFIGKKRDHDPMPFSDMEKNGDSEIVWIFPMWGEKFHKENCRFVKVHPVQKVLTPALKSRYKPCMLCGPEILPVGSYVCCFSQTGSVYHQNTCSMVEKYTIEIEKDDAVEKGYQPCKTCGGG